LPALTARLARALGGRRRAVASSHATPYVTAPTAARALPAAGKPAVNVGRPSTTSATADQPISRSFGCRRDRRCGAPGQASRLQRSRSAVASGASGGHEVQRLSAYVDPLLVRPMWDRTRRDRADRVGRGGRQHSANPARRHQPAANGRGQPSRSSVRRSLNPLGSDGAGRSPMGRQPEFLTADRCFKPGARARSLKARRVRPRARRRARRLQQAGLPLWAVRWRSIAVARPRRVCAAMLDRNDRSAGVSARALARLLRPDANGITRRVQYGGVARRGPRDLTSEVLPA
jgi:hypothetical protein